MLHSFFTQATLLTLLLQDAVHAVPHAPRRQHDTTSSDVSLTVSANASVDAASNCFPALGHRMPNAAPSSLSNWWCDRSTEYAFVGFSYEVSQCQSASKLKTEFRDIRTTFNGRYVRLYGACDRKGFYDDVVEAAWEAGIGVHALIWFGFDGGNQWQTRRDTLISSIKNNPKAKFVTRVVQFGSEPLYDWVLEPQDLADQVSALKKTLQPYGIPVTVSDMAYGYQEHDGAKPVMDAIDFIDAHMLPFFAQDASTAKNAWPLVERDLQWFYDNGEGKKIYLSENGWPSVTSDGVQPNSPDAVADVNNEKDYFNLLDQNCEYFKSTNGGIGWFAHIYSDTQEPGYGIYGTNGKLKFAFKPRTSC